MNDELYHYGVLGMKWGVRKDRAAVSKARAERKAERKAIRATKKDRKAAVKRRSQLSDDELNKRISRLSREKQLKDLSRSELSPGRTKIANITEQYGRQALGTFVGVGSAGLAAYIWNSKQNPAAKSKDRQKYDNPFDFGTFIPWNKR